MRMVLEKSEIPKIDSSVYVHLSALQLWKASWLSRERMNSSGTDETKFDKLSCKGKVMLDIMIKLEIVL